MASRVYHYPVNDIGEVFVAHTHAGASAVHLGYRSNWMTVWMQVDTSMDLEDVRMIVVGTGQDIPDGFLHVCTHVADTGFVWHLCQEASK